MMLIPVTARFHLTAPCRDPGLWDDRCAPGRLDAMSLSPLSGWPEGPTAQAAPGGRQSVQPRGRTARPTGQGGSAQLLPHCQPRVSSCRRHTHADHLRSAGDRVPHTHELADRAHLRMVGHDPRASTHAAAPTSCSESGACPFPDPLHAAQRWWGKDNRWLCIS